MSDLFAERIHPRILENANIDTSSFAGMLGELTAVQTALTADKTTRIEVADQLESQRESGQRVSRQVEQALIKFRAASEKSSEAGEELRSFAIASFKEPKPPIWIDAVATGEVSSDLALLRRVEASLVESQSTLSADLRAKEDTLDTVTAKLAQVGAAIEVSERSLTEVEQRIASAEIRVGELAEELISAVLLAPIRGLPFPVVVLDAYYRAELSTAASRPSCQVSWYQLAGIGKLETGHDTFGGSSVGFDGGTTDTILGPELNGERFLAISDTDGGSLDNNPVWDHAVGPMQFIPSSWSRYGADGNGDTVSDPHNMYDAALAAANHLCGSRSQLSAAENFRVALLGYNRSTSYGVSVQAQAADYARQLSLQ